MEPEGIGALYVAFEQLKARLGAEGLFSPERKRLLPQMPKRIGLVTSVTGAAVRDMINILGRRFPLCDVVIYPSAVQGESAPAELAAGIKAFNRAGNADLIIIGRGGGSLEDLWAFNDENLARTVAASRIPVVSAVGHETDFTICDFAADMRAPTPSAAAELAVPEAGELRSRLSACESQLYLSLLRKTESAREKVKQISSSRALKSPEALLDEKRMTLVSLASGLHNAASAKERLCRASLAALAGKLEALDPLSVISRGYGAIYGDDGSIIKSTGQLDVGQNVTVRLSDGRAVAEIKSVERNGAEK